MRPVVNGIGSSPPRRDGRAKVVGAAVYADDFTLPGMWFGATVRSPHAHAHVRSIRFDREAAPAGAICLTARDLAGPNAVRLIETDWPILAADETLHVGEPVALVAAPTRLDARRALAAVQVDWEPLPAVTSLAEAVSSGAETLAEHRLDCGDVEAALAAAEVVVEGEYACGHQEHIYIECQGMTGWWEEDGGVAVEGSMQCPYYVHSSLCHHFDLPDDRVRVKASAVGGGFGGKEDFPSMIALHAALLARAAERPVRLVYDRHEDIVGTTKRHPGLVRHRSAVDADGRLVALDVEVILDGGAYVTLSPVVLSRAVLHAAGPYRCANVRVRGRVVRTHTATNGAFRGFGAPQSQFAMERQMDAIARRVGLDPFEIRLRNVVQPGDRLPTGQRLDDTTAARDCLVAAAEATDFARRWREAEAARENGGGDDDEPLRGIGLSLYFHGAGFTGLGEHKMRSPATVRLTGEGRLEILTSMVDMGQGCVEIFPQMVCEATGLEAKDVLVAEPDTRRVPDSGPTVASRATMIVGGVVARAARELCARVADWWKKTEQLEGEAVIEAGTLRAGGKRADFRAVAGAYLAAGGEAEHTVRHEPPEWQEFDEKTYRGAAYPAYSWGADVVEVEVDPDTFAVSPRHVTAVCEIGRALHPAQCRGQIEGGTLQAVAWGLLEEVKLDGGRYLNDRLATYIIPTFKDSPKIEVELLERPSSEGPFGAKGVGELPMDGGAPAAAAAVENATGARADAIPATPERIFGWLRDGHTATPAGDGEVE